MLDKVDSSHDLLSFIKLFEELNHGHGFNWIVTLMIHLIKINEIELAHYCKLVSFKEASHIVFLSACLAQRQSILFLASQDLQLNHFVSLESFIGILHVYFFGIRYSVYWQVCRVETAKSTPLNEEFRVLFPIELLNSMLFDWLDCGS